MAYFSKCIITEVIDGDISATPVLSEIVESVQHHSNVRRLIEQEFKMFDSFLFSKVQSEFLLQLFMYISMLDIRNICIDHQRHQVENKVAALPQDGESGETEILETSIMRRLSTTHAVYHLLADLDLWGEWLGITAKNVTKVHWKVII